MRLKYFLFLPVFSLLVPYGLSANPKSKKKKKDAFSLIEAYTQRTIPGIPRAPIHTNTHFIIAWMGQAHPEVFFWRCDSGWFSCNMVKAHKIKESSRFMPPGTEYQVENISPDKVSKGDTLQLTPIIGRKETIPSGIPANSPNTLFYKTTGSGWLSFPIKEIGKKRDITMP